MKEAALSTMPVLTLVSLLASYTPFVPFLNKMARSKQSLTLYTML